MPVFGYRERLLQAVFVACERCLLRSPRNGSCHLRTSVEDQGVPECRVLMGGRLKIPATAVQANSRPSVSDCRVLEDQLLVVFVAVPASQRIYIC